MVAAADPRAVQAGLDMLAGGGSATDAAIAAMAVLGLVEPQSAGVGGGGFMVAYDKASGAVDAYDGREAAPAAATPEYFLDANGKPLPFLQAVSSGKSTGAPSLYAMLKMAHDTNGKLPWAKLFDPAIKLAEEGFIVSPRMSDSIAMVQKATGFTDAAARAYVFTPEGAPLPVGYLRKNPDYAATMRALAKQGPAALQQGPIAEAILKATHADPIPGVLTLADLKNVKPVKRAAICGAYREYKVCGAPPPTSGGIAVIDILGMFAKARPTPKGPADADDWAAFFWASRIAYTDRDYYVADDAKLPVPVSGLIDPRYVAERAKLIDLAKASPKPLMPGDPSIVTGGPSLYGRWSLPTDRPEGGTTHMSIVDNAGNVVAMTASVESVLGSHRMVGGFFLNNQLTDFSMAPTRGGKPVANAVAPGKKPRSSMAPTIVFDKDGKFYAAIGSPGGSSIIAYVAKTIIGVVDWKLSMQDAINQPNVVGNGDTIRIEAGKFPEAIATNLRARGWIISPGGGEISGLNGIRMNGGANGGAVDGGADPRREGVARLLATGRVP
jgi:gamma-glutamyltranspeptidase/glutathione hydrolase